MKKKILATVALASVAMLVPVTPAVATASRPMTTTTIDPPGPIGETGVIWCITHPTQCLGG